MPWHRRQLVRRILSILVLGTLVAWATGLTASPALAANVVNVTIHVPSSVQVNPCFPSDDVNLSGDIHIVITTTANGRSGYQVKAHLNSHMSGYSLVTGTKYVSNETRNAQWSAPPPFPVVDAETYKFNLVSKGDTPNYVVHVTVHDTVNASGDVTDVTADEWSINCR
jgi:hypothetical protein